MRDRAEVVVVGAGPAGVVTALAIKRSQPAARVVLVDRAHFPRDKVCGDGLGPGAIRTLTDMGLIDVLDDVPRPGHVRVSGPGGREGHVRQPVIGGEDLSGAVLPREQFDFRLLKMAGASGVEVRSGCKLKSVDPRTITLSTADGNELVDYSLLIGADGAYSTVRRLHRGFEAVDKRYTHVAMRGYAKLVDPAVAADGSGSLRLDFTEALLPAYGWVFPGPDGIANVGVGIPITLLNRSARSLRQHFDDYVLGLRERGFEIGEVDRVGSHQLPHARGMTRFTSENVALVGDAAAMINPLSGEGIFYGMTAGAMLGDCLRDTDLSDPRAVQRALTEYERAFRRRFRSHFASCWAAHRLLRSKRWAEMLLEAASRDQQVMVDAALLLFDERSIRLSTGLRIALKGLWSMRPLA